VDFSDGEACLDEIALIVSVCLSVFLSPPLFFFPSFLSFFLFFFFLLLFLPPPPFSPFIYLVALV